MGSTVDARSGWRGLLARAESQLRWRPVAGTLSALLAALGAYSIGETLHAATPLGEWLVWRYLVLWAWLALFSASCTSFGYLLLVRCFRARDLELGQSALFGMALGTIAFTLAMYVAGALGAFRPWFAVCLPVVLLAVSARDGARLSMELFRAREAVTARRGLVATAALAFGLMCVGITYFRILTPDALGYDAGWYHVKIAQDYARWGRMGPFPGDYSHALPQLASLLYTWGYLLPGLHVAERWIFALHVEFCLLLWTLAGVTVAVRAQLGGDAPSGTWAAFFLLPWSLLYTVLATSDHVAGFFAIPIVLAALRVFEDVEPRKAALLGAMLGGGVLAKYQIAYLGIPVAGVFVVAYVRAWWSLPEGAERRLSARRLLEVPLALCLTGTLITLPHFLKNAVYYGNPVYPFLMSWFPSEPSVPQGSLLLKYGLQPSAHVHDGGVLEKLRFSLNLLQTIPLAPRSLDPKGSCSLFVLIAPAVLWLGGRALSFFVLVGLGSLLSWGIILADMRYMSAFTPVLAAALAAMLVRLWRLGVLPRVGIALAVLLQVAWAADAPLNDFGAPTVQASIDLIRTAIKAPTRAIFDRYRRDFLDAGSALPRDAKLVVHTSGVTLGIDRDLYMDAMGFQGLIDYRPMRTPRDVFERFRAIGATHTLHEPRGYASHTIQEDVLFHALVRGYATETRLVGPFYIAKLPDEAPPAREPLQVLSVGMYLYADGLYPVDQLGTWERLPTRYRERARPRELLSEARQAALLELADGLVCAGECAIEHAAKAAGLQRVPHHPGDFALFLKPPK